MPDVWNSDMSQKYEKCCKTDNLFSSFCVRMNLKHEVNKLNEQLQDERNKTHLSRKESVCNIITNSRTSIKQSSICL